MRASTAFIRTNDDLEEGGLGGFGVDGGVFRQAKAQATHREGVDPEALYSQIGRLKVELDGLKKVRPRSPWPGGAVESARSLNRQRSDPGTDAVDRRGLRGLPVLRQPPDDGLAQVGRLLGQPQADRGGGDWGWRRSIPSPTPDA